MYSQRRPGRQRGLFRARYSRNVFPNTVFHCFSPLKTYIRSPCCQQHAVRACISATYCHEEALLPSGPPLGIHDDRFLPLFNAQPFHAEHSGGRPASGQRRMRESAWRGSRADREGVPDWRLTRREQGRFGLAARQAETGQVRLANHTINWRHPPFASALAFLLRSPFRSQLRQALHRARNR